MNNKRKMKKEKKERRCSWKKNKNYTVPYKYI
jgi:hypothetical protein